MKKILLISYRFYPENDPRAFRTYELAKELAKKYDVTVLTKNTFSDLSEIKNKYNFKVEEIPSGFFLNKSNGNFSKKAIEICKKNKKNNLLALCLKKLFNYIFYSREIEFSYEIFKFLKNSKEKYDVVISIAVPFSCHIGTWLSFKNKKGTKIILEYGDPFYFNPSSEKIAPYFKYLEKKILNFSDYITIPIEEAKESFKYYGKKNLDKIRIIPQGINFKEIEIEKYSKNTIPTFIYAGIFYEKIRNPIKFLKAIENIKNDYGFFIYTDLERLEKDDMGKEILSLINRNKRIILKNKISRQECIKIMSSMDFLVNIKNLGGVQTPSKLIDYGIVKRPVYSFNENEFSLQEFKEFLNGNYKNSLDIDISPFDIKNVTEKFEELF